MGFMTWEPRYEIGIPEMDKQHKRWLDILNDFYDHLADGNMNEKMETMLHNVMEYTDYHFREEEKLMSSIGYPAISDQKEMHRKIKDKIAEFERQLREGKIIVSMTITSELKSWFKDHIMVEDKKYAEKYFESRSR